MPTDRHMHEANRVSWNAATRQHNSHKGDQAAFLRGGGTTLFPEEVELLGDVRGKTLLHLQCNAGQDTLSIAAHLGAQVTGVDISDEAIDFAQKLAAESGIAGTFVRADIYDWFAQNTTTYDVVFASYGAIPWLSDLRAWGQGIAAALKPGGRFVLVEFHPFLNVYDDEFNPNYDYSGGKPVFFEDGIGDYVADSGGALTHTGQKIEDAPHFHNPHPVYEFCWGVADIVGALLQAGLRLDEFREYPYSNGFKPFADMRELPGRRMTLPEGMPNIPFMLGVAAIKP